MSEQTRSYDSAPGVEDTGQTVTTAEPTIDSVIDESHGAENRDWTRKRAAVTGAITAFLFGIVFFAGYSGTSAWICSSSRDCGQWQPIVIVAVVGVVVFSFLGAVAGLLLNKLYRLFKVV